MSPVLCWVVVKLGCSFFSVGIVCFVVSKFSSIVVFVVIVFVSAVTVAAAFIAVPIAVAVAGGYWRETPSSVLTAW